MKKAREAVGLPAPVPGVVAATGATVICLSSRDAASASPAGLGQHTGGPGPALLSKDLGEELAEDQVEQAKRHDHDRAGPLANADHRRSRTRATSGTPHAASPRGSQAVEVRGTTRDG